MKLQILNDGNVIELQDEGYVDLGLPSGKLWASCNLGATSPCDYGNYYAWGETEPKSDYSWETYKWSNGTPVIIVKYCTNSFYGAVDNKTILEPEDDAVYISTKGEAHMPTRADIDELLNNTDHTWCTCAVGLGEGHETHTVNGRLFTSKTDSTKKIFIPAAGFQHGSVVYNAGSDLYIWSSSLMETHSDNAWLLFSFLNRIYEDRDFKFCGFSVRGVKDKSIRNRQCLIGNFLKKVVEKFGSSQKNCTFALSNKQTYKSIFHMTREDTKKMLPIIQAYAEGKDIEYYNDHTGVWTKEDDPVFGMYPEDYRIKPETKYHPFSSKEECFEEMKKHEPFGWIKDKDCIYNISIIDKDGIYLLDWENTIECYDFEQALTVFTFADCEPFGIKK